ncbi:hypothetical protein LRAMOSA04920 [Lichtheimia ramosa]|uniref:non-specific serine/threonine protein kinase n=1 Tax=Lichtheimia ramosa TaxID=688394 RepID=A0A077WYQ6_9FUNG|nr:hypothetical protein LRAMOSA04920 [Lichtheimia ramosa]
MNPTAPHPPRPLNDYESGSDYSDAESIRSDDEEDLEDYKKGGYHPVSIGDRFSRDRYIVVRKLGWGHFSTVWLAYDTVAERHVALKIVKSAEHFTESALEEIKLLEAVKVSNSNAVGWQHVAQLLDHFWHTGPNGKHVCMTFEVLGESLLSLIKRYRYKGIPPSIVKRITKQVLLGLDYLHRECKIVHTDIKPENVLVWIPDVESYLKKETAEILSQHINKQPSNTATTTTTPVQEPLLKGIDTTGMSKSRKKRLKRKMKQKAAKEAQSTQNEGNGVSLESRMGSMAIQHDNDDRNNTPIIRSAVLDFAAIIPDNGDPSRVFEDIVVKIADLGNACWLESDNTHIIQTRQYRSPEVIVGARWNDRADMWSMAVLVFELLTGEFLFDPRAGTKYDKDDDHLAQIIELMLRVPRSLTMDGEFSREFFNRKGELRRIKKLRYRRLRDVLHDQFQMPPAEADALNEFLSPMLEVDVAKRACAQDILQAKWLAE